MKTLYFFLLIFLLSACQPKYYEIQLIESDQSVIQSFAVEQGDEFEGLKYSKEGYAFEGYYVEGQLIEIPYEINASTTIEMRFRPLLKAEILNEDEAHVMALLIVYLKELNIVNLDRTSLVQVSNKIVFTKDDDMYQDLGWRSYIMIQYIHLNALQTVQVIYNESNQILKVIESNEASSFQSSKISLTKLTEALTEYFNK